MVLFGLVELYLESGKPIGSNTLKENGFQNLSSATIRNYFVELEAQGYLRQPHASGGRVPTHLALRVYADEHIEQIDLSPEIEEKLAPLAQSESRNLLHYLQTSAETLSEATGLATFLSSVRFDHDLITDIKLLSIDASRLLAVIITDFGQVQTEVLPADQRLSTFSLKRVEAHLQWRLQGGEEPSALSNTELLFAQKCYNEIMVRYLVRYSNFSHDDTYRTGFSKLLNYPEFTDPLALTTGLSLFENQAHMRLLLNDCLRRGELSYWVGSELGAYIPTAEGCSVIAIPYYLGSMRAGAVGVLGPCRIPYRSLFATLTYFSHCISKSLTKSLLKFKLSYRTPRSSTPFLQEQERAIVDQTSKKLLEIKDQT